MRFSTAFVRPDLFRFHVVQMGHGSVKEWISGAVWSADGGFRSWTRAMPQVRQHESIDAANGAVAVSSRASLRVPSLLVGSDPRGVAADDATSPVRIARTAALACAVFAVPFGEDQEETLWIACDSGLIVRVEWEFVLDARSRERAEQATERMLASEEVPDAFKARVRETMEKHRPWDLPDTRVRTTTVYRPTLGAEIASVRFAFTPPFVGPPAWER